VGLMNEELRALLAAVMTTAGLPTDSSEQIAFHLALHYPTHAQTLIDYRSPQSPADLDDGADSIPEPPELPGVPS